MAVICVWALILELFFISALQFGGALIPPPLWLSAKLAVLLSLFLSVRGFGRKAAIPVIVLAFVPLILLSSTAGSMNSPFERAALQNSFQALAWAWILVLFALFGDDWRRTLRPDVSISRRELYFRVGWGFCLAVHLVFLLLHVLMPKTLRIDKNSLSGLSCLLLIGILWFWGRAWVLPKAFERENSA